MASFAGCFLFLTLVSLHRITSTTTQQTCETRYCGDPSSHGPSIQSPFYLKGVQSEACGYPKFGVFCNNLNQTLITLGNAGDFVVKDISLKDQQVSINDPNNCLPSRFLHGDLDLRLQVLPFQWSSDYISSVNVDFLNCTGPLPPPGSFRTAHRNIPCLSGSIDGGDNFTVVAVLFDLAFPTTWMSFPPGCRLISSSLVPVDSFESEQLWNNLIHFDIRLKWSQHNCIFPDPDHEDTACYNKFLDPEPAHYKVVVLVVAGSLFFCVAGLARLIGAKVGARRRRRMMDGELERINTAAESVDSGMGLDESTIERYPKTQVGENGRLPNNPGGDNVCSICLSEYEPMDTLRTIPHCNHYFHAHCIDEWLKKKGTCPLCRHLPHAPSLSLSITSSASHPLPRLTPT